MHLDGKQRAYLAELTQRTFTLAAQFEEAVSGACNTLI